MKKAKCPKCGSDVTNITEFSIDYSYPYSCNTCTECGNEFIVQYEMKVKKVWSVKDE